jgi:hypothetical protein
MIVIIQLSKRRYIAIDVPDHPTGWRSFGRTSAASPLGYEHTSPSWQTQPMSWVELQDRIKAHVGDRALCFEDSVQQRAKKAIQERMQGDV